MAAIVIAIPHSAVALPEDLEPPFLSRVDEAFLFTQSDAFTDRIYEVPEVRTVRYRWSRFVADPNRAELQLSEGGVVPVTDFDLQPLYPDGGEPTEAQQQARVVRYHRPYHKEVAAAVAQRETRFFVDGHSMTSSAPRRSPDRGRERPDAVVSNRGNEQGNPSPGKAFLTCPPALTRFAAERLSHWLVATPLPGTLLGARPSGEVRMNEPFAGGYGVRSHAAPNQGLPGIQLELNQRLWCDEGCLEPLAGRVEWMQSVVSAWARDMTARLEASGPEPTQQAAS